MRTPRWQREALRGEPTAADEHLARAAKALANAQRIRKVNPTSPAIAHAERTADYHKQEGLKALDRLAGRVRRGIA